jgi:hypothetical protein
MSGLKGRSGPPHNQNAVRHGLYYYKRLLSGDELKHSTALYHALVAKEQEMVVALGGNPSPQERVIIADTVKTQLYVGSLDAYLMQLKSLVRKGKVHAVLIERTRLAGHLRENLKTIGLKRIQKTLTLAELLAQGDGEEDGEQGDGNGDPGGPEPDPKHDNTN